MAVSSLLTSLEDMQGAPTIQDYGGGQGAAVNTDIFIEGTQSVGRRVDNTTDKGHGVSFTNADLSAAGEHIKIWVFVTQWAEVTQVQIRISDDTNDDDHELPTIEFPPLGGFIPVWVDVSRAPEIGGSANEASIGEVGCLLDIGDVGGNAPNLIIDEVMHGTSGLRWTGTGPGAMSDFRTFEDTNNEGNLINLNGVDFCYSRLEVGNGATESDFTDSGFTLVFPDQALVADTFMGVTVVLGNASSVVDISNATMQSANPASATKRPDFLVSGTTGSLDLDTVNLLGMRIVDLNSACTVLNSILSNCGIVDAAAEGTAGADLSGSSILNSIVAADEGALFWDVNEDPDTKTDGMTFSQGANAHHAIRFGDTIPAAITLRNIEFTDFDSTDSQNGSTLRFDDTTGTITVNLVGCTVGGAAASAANIGVDSAGATINLVVDPVDVDIHIDDNAGNAYQNARILLIAADGTGIFPFEVAVTITRAGAVATVTHNAHGMETGDIVMIGKGVDQVEYSGAHSITRIDANSYSFPVSGTPATPATGTIEATGGFIDGVSDASGNISVSRVVGTDTPVKGFIRASTTSPRFKSIDLAGNTVAASGGLSVSRRFQLDE